MFGSVEATRREQAVQLRLAGLSRSQIAEAMGLADGGQPLTKWLRDVPPPAWTKRPNAKDDLRARAIALREAGKSYREISDVVPVSKSTLSLWLRDIPLTEEQRAALALRCPAGASKRAIAIRANAAQRRAGVHADALAQIGALSESELFVAGVAIYWAEGSKNKPWRTGARVSFLNSDPAMIRLFLCWLRLVGIDADRLQFRVCIHESADVEEAEAFWADVVSAPRSEFQRTTLKRHNPRTTRRNVGSGYHGCLCVSVRRSTDLNLRIAGWFEGIVAAAGTMELPSGVV